MCIFYSSFLLWDPVTLVCMLSKHYFIFTVCFLYSLDFLQLHFQFNFCLRIMFILHSAFKKSLTIPLAGSGMGFFFCLFLGFRFFVCFEVCGLFWHRLISLLLTVLWFFRLHRALSITPSADTFVTLAFLHPTFPKLWFTSTIMEKKPHKNYQMLLSSEVFGGFFCVLC